MDNVKVIMNAIKADIRMTPEQWGMYTASAETKEEKQSLSFAADTLNTAAEKLAAHGVPKADFIKRMNELRSKFADTGVSDTEGRYALHNLVEALYGHTNPDEMWS